jgi:hypothetical protein
MDKDKIFRAEAIPFILINEKQEDGKLTYEFELQKQAADIISALKNKKVFPWIRRLPSQPLQGPRDRASPSSPIDSSNACQALPSGPVPCPAPKDCGFGVSQFI